MLPEHLQDFQLPVRRLRLADLAMADSSGFQVNEFRLQKQVSGRSTANDRIPDRQTQARQFQPIGHDRNSIELEAPA